MTPLIPDPTGWPRYLSREEAARYVSVPVEIFDAEVAGQWPTARRRGSQGELLTSDRCDRDSAADLTSGWETLTISALWGLDELATFLRYKPSTLRTLILRSPEKLPPRVRGVSLPRWEPSVCKDWAARQSVPETPPRRLGLPRK
jgi:hypothetical protein